ncbi:MAG TPA: cytochrome c [Terriglobales bacterium]|jgi:mono/diheme cytochrome c family protein|nr:cytochrome c [Terriglobales bacterium]
MMRAPRDRSRKLGIGNIRTVLPALLALIAATAGCRIDMHMQPYYRPMDKSDFFADNRSARMPVDGTVARGDLQEDTYFYTAKIGNATGDYMPFAVTSEVLSRGRERYNITCAPCHGRVGDGNGFIPTRGFRQPPSFHIDRLRKVPVGYFFDVDTHGYGVMPDYAAQVAPRDRWCIAAYIRALQLSQNATAVDIPAGQKVPSPAPAFRDIGTGATLPVPAPAPSASENEGEPK